MKKAVKAIAAIAVLALTGCTQSSTVAAEISSADSGIVTLTYQDAAGHWCAVAVRGSWADDAAAHMGELVSYDIQSGTIRLDGGVQA